MSRWWGIRHGRWLWHAWHLSRWLRLWAPYGYIVPNPADARYLEDIWDGVA